MNLITPDPGLFIWMTIIFCVVLFILAKYAFPLITRTVEERTKYIQKSLDDAEATSARIRHLEDEQKKVLEKAREDQRAIIKDATKIRDQIIEAAKEDAREEAANIISQARVEIAAEKESALRDLRKMVAMLSLQVSDNVLRKNLDGEQAQVDYINKMVDEISRKSN